MIFYRTLMPFQVMSFDLDDTLYDNTQVIANAEAEFIRFVQTHGAFGNNIPQSKIRCYRKM